MNPRLIIVLCLAFCSLSAHAGEPLEFLVYGASGKVGGHIVGEALARGHRVTAVSRDPARMTETHENLSVVKGDLLDGDSVATLVAGRDIVVVSVRGVVGDSGDPADTVVRIGAQRVVEALRRNGEGAGRLLHVGGASTLELKPGVLLADRLPMALLPKSFELEIGGQILVLDYLRGVSDVDWTYVTPPRTFIRGKRRGEYRIGGDRLMVDAQGKSKLSRADFAVAVVDEAENAAFVRKRFSVAY
jgi:putative NADH-flavin reductase